MAVGDVTVIYQTRQSATIFVEREPTATGWTLYVDGVTVAVLPVDPLAAIPDPFVYTIEPLDLGDHTIQVDQTKGQSIVASGSTVVTIVPDPMRPTVAEVAALIRARTKDSDGREVGTFNDETRPTDTQVEVHISNAIALLAPRWPINLDDSFYPAIRALTAYRAALQIEKSYYPEQVRSDRSAYDQLREEYQEDLASLMDALGVGEDGGSALGSGPQSIYTPTFLRVYGQTWPEDHWPEPENPANWRNPKQPPREPPLAEDLPVGDEPASGTWLP